MGYSEHNGSSTSEITGSIVEAGRGREEREKAAGEFMEQVNPETCRMWPTSTAMDTGGRKTGNAILTKNGTLRHKNKAGGQSRLGLDQAVRFATPQARDFRTGQKSRWDDPERSRNLNDQIGGQLKLAWVEWLIGFPLGWSDLNV